MNILPYETFGRLRLRSFCPNEDFYSETTHEHSKGHFISEKIPGVDFVRCSPRSDELAMINIDFDIRESSGSAPDVVPAILSAIGVGLQAGLSWEETESRFDTPPHWRKTDGSYAIFRIGKNSPYEVHCIFPDNAKLRRVGVARLDTELPG